MPPKKLQPQRKKQKATGESSSAAQQRILLSTQTYAKDRKKLLVKKDFMNSQYVDWELMREYGMEEKIRGMITDEAWFRLLAIQEPAYKNLTIEFLSTMKLEGEGNDKTLTFQAFGEVSTIELKQVGYFLGIYDTEEEALDLPNSWPAGMNAEAYWFELIAPKRNDFVPSKSVASTFASVEHKLLHHILAHTISCKKTSHNKVTSFDMFYLYSMITGYKIDLGVEVANLFVRQMEDTRTKVILCGGYITALLKGMYAFKDADNDIAIDSKKISSAPFRAWGLFKVTHRANEEEIEEAHDISPTPRASTSRAAPSHDALSEELRSVKHELQGVKKEYRKEQRKNKRFRTTLFNMLKSAISCMNPAAAQDMHYETSPEALSEEEADDHRSSGEES